MSEKKRFICHADIKKVQELPGGLVIEGWASTADIDRAYEVVEPDAIERGIQNFLKNPILLYMHNYSFPIGRVIEMSIDSIEGFWIKAVLSNADDVKDIVTKIKEKIIRAFSIGFRELDGKLLKDIYKIIELEMYEVSVVTIPMNAETLFSVTKGFVHGTDVMTPIFMNGEKQVKFADTSLTVEEFKTQIVEELLSGELSQLSKLTVDPNAKVIDINQSRPEYSHLKKVLAEIREELSMDSDARVRAALREAINELKEETK